MGSASDWTVSGHSQTSGRAPLASPNAPTTTPPSGMCSPYTSSSMLYRSLGTVTMPLGGWTTAMISAAVGTFLNVTMPVVFGNVFVASWSSFDGSASSSYS